MSEQDIQRKAKKWLESKGCYVTKVNPGVYSAPSGHYDLFVSIPMEPFPVAVYLEAKTPTGRVSLAQKIWGAQMEGAGHLVGVFRSIEDIERLFEGWGIIL